MDTPQEGVGRYLGIDYGSKRVGIATSDEFGVLAFPHSVLPNDDELVAKIAELCRSLGARGVVMGESRDFAMKENPVMSDARAFAVSLEVATGLKVSLEPEFMTSQQARATSATLGVDVAAVDAGAAAIILQTGLDRMRFIREEESGVNKNPYLA